MLTKSLLVVNFRKEYCTFCSGKQCFHYQATIQCMQQQCLAISEPCTLNDVTYFPLNKKTIFFLESDYHCYLNKERKWYCETCPGVCKQKHRFQPILTTLDQPIERESEIKYSTISTLPIPVSLDESMTQVYTRQLSRGLELPLNIYLKLNIVSMVTLSINLKI